jgi:hypothetical protein
MARIAYRDPIHLGLDVHRDTISVATLLPDAAAAAVEQIPSDEAAVLAFVGRFAEPGRLRVCYEAGPTGYELARLLHSRGVACQVIAPSLTPRAVGDKVKTDRRDCRRLARLHRAGELVAIRIPPLGRRRSGICAAPGPTWSMIAAGLAGGCSRCCWATVGSIAPVPAGPASTSAGWAPSASTTSSCKPPSPTTGQWWPPATRKCLPSRPT